MTSLFLTPTQHPIPPPDAAAKSLSPRERFPLLVGKRVMIVEDEGVTLFQLRRICQSLGLHIVGAGGTAEEGVTTALEERPELILMDIRMPGKKNGLDAAEEILEEYNACVVILTAFPEEESRTRARQIGTHGYVIKPVDLDNLPPQLVKAWEEFRKSEPPQ